MIAKYNISVGVLS